MPDPSAPAIAFYYVDSDEALVRLTTVLIRKGEWFDVRRPKHYKWSICFNAIVTLAPIYRKTLIVVESLAINYQHNIATYKAKERTNVKGRRK